MSSDQNSNPVIVIYVQPSTRRYCNYMINDSSYHTKTYEELSIYLKSILPNLSSKFVPLIEEKKSFVILVDEGLVQPLKFDLEAELKHLSKTWTFDNIHKALKDTNYSTSKKDSLQKKIDLSLKQISNNHFVDNFLKK